MPGKKIICVILVYYDFGVIKKSLESVLPLQQMMDFVIIENPSEFTDFQIKPYILGLLDQQKIKKYILFEKNITNNAVELAFDKGEINLSDYEYLVLTDGDLQCYNNDWLDEELNMINNVENAFCVATDLDTSNLPVENFPDAVNWIPNPIAVEKNYAECLTGTHFLLFRTEDFSEYLSFQKKSGLKHNDSTMHKYCYEIAEKKWFKTIKNKVRHLTWDSYSNPEHPYTKLRLGKAYSDTWNHDEYCNYTVFETDYKRNERNNNLSNGIPGSVDDLFAFFNFGKPVEQGLTQELPDNTKEALDDFFCPVCRNKIERFNPIPEFYFEKQRQSGFRYSPDEFETFSYMDWECPFCMAIDRERLYSLFLDEKIMETPVGKKLHLLDFAPSKAFSDYIRWHNTFNYLTADLNRGDYDKIINIEDMKKFSDNSFDCFICSHILEHAGNDRKALSELYRILKPGGWGILMVPVCLSINEDYENPSARSEAERLRNFGQEDHIRLYSRQGFISKITKAGFTHEELDKNFFGAELFKKSGISQGSILYVVGK